MRTVRTLIVPAFIAMTRLATACPMCKDSIAATKGAISASTGGNNGSSVASGFNYSVYLMLGMLFLSLGLVAFNLTRGIRSK